MRAIKFLAEDLLKQQNFDAMAIARLDFKKNDFFSFKIAKNKNKNHEVYFDLASLTKPLTSSFYALENEVLDFNSKLLLNHKAGFSPWARLDKRDWKFFLDQKVIKESKEHYSDLSHLRLMLEIQKKNKNFPKYVSQFWDTEVTYWLDLEEKNICVPTGTRNHKLIQGIVHDDNAFNLNDYCNHAGLFSTIEGLSKTLLKSNSKLNLINKMYQEIEKKEHERFALGFDTPTSKQSLASEEISPYGFGHLGFTGNSFWIDCEKEVGCIILTNATRNYWYERVGLNCLRKKLNGEMFKIK